LLRFHNFGAGESGYVIFTVWHHHSTSWSEWCVILHCRIMWSTIPHSIWKNRLLNTSCLHYLNNWIYTWLVPNVYIFTGVKQFT